ncbi:MAG: monovalent cation:proton antiporter family protein [Acidobacteriota bacterium]
MEHLAGSLFPILLAFAFVALAAQQIGDAFARLRLPLITGFLLAGLVAGPHVLGLMTSDALSHLRFVDELTLAFIAFAAGGELHLDDLRGRLASIRWVTLGLVVVTFLFSVVALLLLAEQIPFTRGMPLAARWAVALLGGAVLVARSPSSAIAIVNEMRAKGPFTGMVMGVTVVMDAVVIVLFAASSSIADALIGDTGLDPWIALLVLGELGLSIALGYLLGRILPWILRARRRTNLQSVALLTTGYLVFTGCEALRHLTRTLAPVEVLVEPLLVCMVGAFVATNFTRCRGQFHKILNVAGPPVYVVFFTLAGATLALDVLAETWGIAVILFAVRLAAIAAGSSAGGFLAGDPARLIRVGWMGFVTQAGISLGLAKEIAAEFPSWGNSLATILISVIVMNQIAGPPLFKWALQMVGEARLGQGLRDLRGVPRALIFGWDAQALALARQLDAHGWQVKVASRKLDTVEPVPDSGVKICPLAGLTLEALREAGAGEAHTLVGLLTDEENYQIAALADQHLRTARVIVQLHDRSMAERFRAVHATPVDPHTALISLLDQFVRSPAAASLLLGMEGGQEIVEVPVRSPALQGMALRDLHLPLDTLVISVHRNGATLISHGYTRLELGDRVTMVGSGESLREMALRLEA